MGFKHIPRIPVGADLSAFAGCSGIPLHLLNRIIGPLHHPSLCSHAYNYFIHPQGLLIIVGIPSPID